MDRKNKRLWVKTLIPPVSLLIGLSLFLHIALKPVLPSFVITYACDSVSIGLDKDSLRLQNFYVERDGIPGAMVFYEGVMIVAFVDPVSYWSAKQTTPIVVEADPDGVTVSITPTYVTSGPYAYLPYELTGNRDHVPDSEGKLFIIDNRDNVLFNQKSRKII